jgi:hypothetical protein
MKATIVQNLVTTHQDTNDQARQAAINRRIVKK